MNKMNEASDLVANVVAKYGSCTSYKDRGTVSCGSSILSFSTYMLRPNRFRLEWVDELNRSRVIRCKDGKTYSYFGTSVYEDDTLGWALTFAAGASNGISGFIGELLMPECFGETRLYRGSRLLQLMPFSYNDDNSQNKTQVRSNDEKWHFIEQLVIDQADLKICERESFSKPELVDEMKEQMNNLPINRVPNDVEKSIDSVCGPAAYLTSHTIYETVIFDELSDAELQMLDEATDY